MKKPEKIEPNCPLIQGPCVEDGCKFWLQMERKNLATGAVEKYQECAYIIHVAVITESSMAMNRMGASVDALRNETMEVRRAMVPIRMPPIAELTGRTP